jgi:hypothetical protein
MRTTLAVATTAVPLASLHNDKPIMIGNANLETEDWITDTWDWTGGGMEAGYLHSIFGRTIV